MEIHGNWHISLLHKMYGNRWKMVDSPEPYKNQKGLPKGETAVN